MTARRRHLASYHLVPTCALSNLIRLLTLVLTVITVGCGGGTRGSGGQLYDGFIGDESKSALTNVNVTIVETGDSAVSDQEGRFIIRTERLAGPITLLVERTDLSTTVRTESIPSDATVIQLTITVGAGANPTANASIEVRERKSPSPAPSATPNDSSGGDRENDDSSSGGGSRDDDNDSDDDDSNDDNSSGGGGSDDSGGSGSGSGGNDSNGDDSSSNDPRDGDKRDVEGSISALNTTQITVSGISFNVTSSSEFRDAKGKDTTLASFSLGNSVRARGVYQGGKLLLTRLEMR